jgi:acyl carrier protein
VAPIQQDVLAVLRRHLRDLQEEEPVPLETHLRDLGLDSMGAVNLLLDLEQTFQVVFPDELLTEETFRSAASLSRALASLQTGRGEG